MVRKEFTRVSSERLVASLLVFVVGAPANIAYAQSPGGFADQSRIEEVVVTARKREESLQEIPLAVTAFTEQALREQNVRALEDLAQWTPGLSFQDVNGAFQNPIVRGLSQVDQTSIQGNVGVFVDGVFLSNRSGLEFGLLDLARVEVVKGPQSALYGRNTFAGAINYVTKSPLIGERDASLYGTFGSDERLEARASVNMPIGERSAVRVFGGVSEFDGTIDNRRTGEKLGGHDNDAFGASALFQPSDALTLRLFAARNSVENDAVALTVLDPNLANCGSTVDFGGTTYNTFFCGPLPKLDAVDIAEVAQGSTGETDIYYGTLTYDASFGTVTAQVSRLESNFSVLLDTTADPVAVDTPSFLPGLSRQVFINATTPLGETTEVELRLENSTDRFSWTIGGSYYDSRDQDVVDIFFQPFAQPSAAPTFFSGRGRDVKTESTAIFGALSYRVTDRLEIGTEVRFTNEDQDMVGLGNSAGVSGAQDFDFVTPRFTLAYQYSDEVLVYANAARGVKAGGFNANGAGRPEFTYDIESNWTYEIGSKATLFSGRLVSNLSLFYVDWQDIQQQRAIEGTNVSVVQNSGDATSTGIELSANALVTDNFSIQVAMAVMDPELADDFYDGEVAATCGDFEGTLITSPGCSPTDSGGRQIARTSDLQFSISAQQEFPGLIGDFDGFARLDYSHEEGKYATGLNLANQGDISLANLRAGLISDRYEISLWVDNLFDEKWSRRATTVPFSALGAPASGITQFRVNPGELRTFGLDFGINF